MSMSKKRAGKLAENVYNRETGSKNGALGDLKDYGSVSLDGADAAADSVDRQTNIENAQDERQVKNKKARTLQKAGEEAAAKIKKRRKQKLKDSNNVKFEEDYNYPTGNIPSIGKDPIYDKEDKKKVGSGSAF